MTWHDKSEPEKRDRIAEIKQRLEAATPGPWRFWREGRFCEVASNSKTPIVPFGGFDDSDRKLQEHFANAALIAHAPADLAVLLELCELYEERLASIDGGHPCDADHREHARDALAAGERIKGGE